MRGAWPLSTGGRTDIFAPDATLRATLEAAGVLDFRELDEAGLLAWCAALGHWPQGMEQTLDRAALKIEVTDIEAADAKAREEAEKREAKERSVRIDGRDEDPKTADWTKISDAIAEKLSRRIKRTTLGTLTDLGPSQSATEVRTMCPRGGRAVPPRGCRRPKRT